MKIYTRTGDEGETSLFGGQRVAKDHLRLTTYGTFDELNAVLGVARAELTNLGDVATRLDSLLGDVQHRLFDLGAELATPTPQHQRTALIASAPIERLEQAIDEFESGLEPLRTFILPGGCAAAAELHVARCVCRRAERHLTTLMREVDIRPEVVAYLNRLSDFLFVAAREANRLTGTADVPWQKPTD